MNSTTSSNSPAQVSDLNPDLEAFAALDTGGRSPAGNLGFFIAFVAFAWSTFQLYVSSALPYWIAENLGVNLIFNGSEVRIIHLAFAMALACLSYPLFKSSPKFRIPAYDWVLAIGSVICCLYLIIFKDDIAGRAGLPTTGDIMASAFGLILLATAVFRSLGLPMLIVAGVFVFYVFFGDAQFLPDVVQWKGASFGKARRLRGCTGCCLVNDFSFRTVWCAARAGWCRQLLYPTGVWLPWAFSRWPCEGRCGGVSVKWDLLRIIHRERSNHRHLYHSFDETYGFFC